MGIDGKSKVDTAKMLVHVCLDTKVVVFFELYHMVLGLNVFYLARMMFHDVVIVPSSKSYPQVLVSFVVLCLYLVFARFSLIKQ